MDELTPTSTRAVQQAAGPTRCGYCGAALNPAYYFCAHCATPYKSVESVLPVLHAAPLSEGALIERKAPHVWPLFWTYAAVVLSTAVVCYFAFGPRPSGLKLIVQSVALFVTTCVFAALHWPSLIVQFRKLGFLHPMAWIGLLVLAPLLAVNYGYHSVIEHLLGPEVTSPFEELRDAGMDEATLVFLLCVLPALLEEVAFRGLVQHWLQVAVGPVRALVLASALFTTMHGSILSAPYLFAVGLLLGAVKWKTGSLYPSMLIHFAHNFVVLEFFPK